jgi:hypothetical protein
MPTKIRDVQLPRGMARTLYRFPIKLFRLHVGWLLMGHFLLLTHIGRTSGLPRQTILEVLLHDHGELHVLVDRAIQVVGARSTPRANLMAGIPGELQTADLRRARLLFGFGSAIHPLAKANEMDVRRVIDQVEALPFLDGDAERLNAHVYVGDMTTTATRVVGSSTLTACDDKH